MRIQDARAAIGKSLKWVERQVCLAGAYQSVWNSPDGRVVLEDILRAGGLVSVASDPADSRFYDGKRAVALHVISRLRFREARVVELALEQQQELDAEAAA